MNQSQLPLSAFIDPRGKNKAEIEQLAQQILEIVFTHLQNAYNHSPLPQITELPEIAAIPDTPISESKLLAQLETILVSSMNPVLQYRVG